MSLKRGERLRGQGEGPSRAGSPASWSPASRTPSAASREGMRLLRGQARGGVTKADEDHFLSHHAGQSPSSGCRKGEGNPRQGLRLVARRERVIAHGPANDLLGVCDTLWLKSGFVLHACVYQEFHGGNGRIWAVPTDSLPVCVTGERSKVPRHAPRLTSSLGPYRQARRSRGRTAALTAGGRVLAATGLSVSRRLSDRRPANRSTFRATG